MKRPLALLSSLLGLTCACGTAAGPTYAPPLVTFNGTIVSSAVATPASVRVALVWTHPRGQAPSSLVSVQELDVHAEFPATFHLDVHALPPAGAMHPIDPRGIPGVPNGYALGSLIVYEDTNGNGRLDSIPVDAQTSVDRILGAPERLEIIYLEGGGIPQNPNAPPSDEDYIAHSAGFNLVFEPANPRFTLGCTDPDCAWTRIDTDANLTIALTADPRLGRRVCEATGGYLATSTSNCSACTGSACERCLVASKARIDCAADKSFTAVTCSAASLCAASRCESVSGRLAPSGPIPAGWPCP